MNKLIIIFFFIIILFFKNIKTENFSINPIIFLKEIKDNPTSVDITKSEIQKMNSMLSCYKKPYYYKCINTKDYPYVKPLIYKN